MRAVDLICPGCGAPLSANGDRRFIFCSYCGKQIYLEETVDSKASNASAGEKQRAQHGPNMELAGKLRKARDKLAQREELERQIETTQNSLLAAKKASLGIVGIMAGVFAVPLILFFLNKGLAILCFCLGGVNITLVFKNKKQKKVKAIAETEQQLTSLFSQKEQYAHEK